MEIGVARHITSPANDDSVPGNRHTAVPGSYRGAKSRVPVRESRTDDLSPTRAGRERTLVDCSRTWGSLSFLDGPRSKPYTALLVSPVPAEFPD